MLEEGHLILSVLFHAARRRNRAMKNQTGAARTVEGWTKRRTRKLLGKRGWLGLDEGNKGKYIIAALLWLAVASLSAFSLQGCGSQPAARQPEAGLKSILWVGTTATHPPFTYRDAKTGELTGFDLQLIRAIAQAEGMEVKVKVLDQEGLWAALKAGTIDAAIGALSPTEGLTKEVDFSDAYLTVRLALCAPRGATIKALGDLAGKKVGVVGPTAQLAKEKQLKGLPNNAQLQPYPSLDKAWEDLLSGKIQALLGDRPSLVYILDRHPQAGLVLAGLELTKSGLRADSTADSAKESSEIPLAIAIGKDDEFLRAKINHGLRQVKLTGWFDLFYSQHFVPR